MGVDRKRMGKREEEVKGEEVGQRRGTGRRVKG